MRALLIDPTAGKREVTVIEINGGLQSIYEAIGCTHIEAPISYPNRDVMYVDGEIWTNFFEKDPEEEILMGGFMFNDWAYPIFGKALIVGTDEEGDSADCLTNPHDLWRIQWKSYDEMMAWGMSVGLV